MLNSNFRDGNTLNLNTIENLSLLLGKWLYFPREIKYNKFSVIKHRQSQSLTNQLHADRGILITTKPSLFTCAGSSTARRDLRQMHPH